MNSMSLAILAIASSLAMLLLSPASKNNQTFTQIPHEKDNVLWDDQAVTWLLEAQSPNGGWEQAHTLIKTLLTRMLCRLILLQLHLLPWHF